MSQSESSRKHYLKNRVKRLAENKLRKITSLNWLRVYKATQSCKLCGESYPYCLDFHHKNPEEKVCTISAIAHCGYSVDSIKKEIEKCDVLCANCHRKLTFPVGV